MTNEVLRSEVQPLFDALRARRDAVRTPGVDTGRHVNGVALGVGLMGLQTGETQRVAASNPVTSEPHAERGPNGL